MIHKQICHEIHRDGKDYLRIDADGEESWYAYSSFEVLYKLDSNAAHELEDWFQDHH